MGSSLLDDPAQLAAFVNTLIDKRFGPTWQQATVTNVTRPPGGPPFQVQVQRLGDSQPDGGNYVVAGGGYVPQAGDTVDMQRRDAATSYVATPVNQGAMMAAAHLIQSVTLGENATAVTFGGMPPADPIPQTFSDLLLIVYGRSTDTGTGGYVNVAMQLNGDTSGGHYGAMTHDQSSTSAGTYSGTYVGTQNYIPWTTMVPNSAFFTPGGGTCLLPGYTSTILQKFVISGGYRGDAGGAAISHRGGFWTPANAQAILQLTAVCVVGSFTAGSVFELLGIL